MWCPCIISLQKEKKIRQSKTQAIDGLQEEENDKIYRLKGARNIIFDRLKSNILEKFGEGSKRLRGFVHSCKEQNRRIWITAIEHIKIFYKQQTDKSNKS